MACIDLNIKNSSYCTDILNSILKLITFNETDDCSLTVLTKCARIAAILLLLKLVIVILYLYNFHACIIKRSGRLLTIHI